MMRLGEVRAMNTPQRPFKTIHDKRLAYLVSLEGIYKEDGYTTRLNGRDNLLEIYPRGSKIPKTHEEITLEKWAN